MKLLFQIAVQIFAVAVTLYACWYIPIFLILTGNVRIRNVAWLFGGLQTIYFALNLATFVTGLIVIIATAKSAENRLDVCQGGFGVGILRYWYRQNIVIALACVAVYFILWYCAQANLESQRREINRAKNASGSFVLPNP